MNKIFNILPSLTAEQNEKKAAGAIAIDNFTVKKCPLMDNFESMDPTTMWKPLIGSEINLEPKLNLVNAKIIAQPYNHNSIYDSMTVLTDSSNNRVDSSNNVIKPFYKNMLPKILGITHKQGADKNDKSVTTNMVKLDTATTVYVGALSLIGLFVLYRVVNKTI
jgi:hypothetical protein